MNKYIKYSVFGILLSLLWVISHADFANAQAVSLDEVFRLLSDAFFVPGVLLIGAAGLMLASKKGLFDLFYYSMSIKTLRLEQSFGEFKASMNKGEKNPVPMMMTGAGFMLVSVLFCCLYFI